MQISFLQTVLDTASSLWTQLRAAVLIPISDTQHDADDHHRESEFAGWLRDDPRVTMNPASQYARTARGYRTSNGIGSLEIGAADD